MRKFKIKNRPKRKYTKKAPTPPSHKPYKPTAITLVPIMLIFLASLTVYIFQSQITLRQTPNLQLTLPTIPAMQLPDINALQKTTSTKLSKTAYQTTGFLTTAQNQIQIEVKTISTNLNSFLQYINNQLFRLSTNLIHTIIFTINLTIQTTANFTKILFQIITFRITHAVGTINQIIHTIIFTIKFTIRLVATLLTTSAIYAYKSIIQLLSQTHILTINIKRSIIYFISLLIYAIQFPSLLIEQLWGQQFTNAEISIQKSFNQTVQVAEIVIQYILQQLQRTIKFLTNFDKLSYLTD